MEKYIVKHKARKTYTCAGCGKTIEQGVEYWYSRKPWQSKKPYTKPKYHIECLPQQEPVVEPKPATEPKVENTEIRTEPEPIKTNPIINRPRDLHGHFVRIYNLEEEGK